MKITENLGKIVLGLILLGMASIPWWFVIPSLFNSTEVMSLDLIIFFISWSSIPFLGSMVVLYPFFKSILGRRAKKSNIPVDEQKMNAGQTDESIILESDMIDKSSTNRPRSSLSQGMVLLFMGVVPWGLMRAGFTPPKIVIIIWSGIVLTISLLHFIAYFLEIAHKKAKPSL